MKLKAKMLCLVAFIAAANGMPNDISFAHALPSRMIPAPSESPATSLHVSKRTALMVQAQVMAQAVLQDNKDSAEMQGSINSFNGLLMQLSIKISRDHRQLLTTQKQIGTLNQSISRNSTALANAKQNLIEIIRGMYEAGPVSYLAVLFQASSFSDLISRFLLLQEIAQYRKRELQTVSAFRQTLHIERQRQATEDRELKNQLMADQALQKVDLSLKSRQQSLLENVTTQLKTNSKNLAHLESRLTQSEIAKLKTQIAQMNAILSSNVPDVSEANLRYQNINPTILLAYVQGQGSIFSLHDIKTICRASKTYDISPVLMLAITGQEQSFVPADRDAAKIRNNPFNVFYSWQVYNTNLADAANIAADTLRHKLSAPPPTGENPILWINDPANPWGIYATDIHWAYGVDQIYTNIMRYVSTSKLHTRLKPLYTTGLRKI